MTTASLGLRQRLGIVVLIAGLIAALTPFIQQSAAFASGDGSPEDCKGIASTDTQTDVSTITATAGKVVTAICIKAGQLHTELLSADGEYSGTYQKKNENADDTTETYKYTVSGLGTGTVTVTQNDGPGVSHLDYLLEDEVDFCDPSQRPAGMSIAEWVPDDVDCVDFEYTRSCGSLDVTLTNDTGLFYEVRASVDDGESTNVFPLTFDEGESGGSVKVELWLEGAEKDYVVGRGIANYWEENFESVTVTTDCEGVDFCDPDQRPAGMSIAEWVPDDVDCVDFDYTPSCGSLDVALTNDTGLFYEVRASVDGGDSTNVFPLKFDEDEFGGSVDVDLWLEGAEADYVTGRGIPNYWEENFATVTVNTNCDTPTITTTPDPEPETFDITFLKDWAGDVNGVNEGTTVDTTGITVEFTVAVNDVELEDTFAPGDVLEVEEGDDVAITGETLSDLGDETCASTPALPDGLMDIDADASLTVINTVDCADVLAEVIEKPEEKPAPEPETEVLAEVEELPETGASALLMTLMGLLSIGVGGGMISTRKRS